MKNSIPRYTFYKNKYGSELLIDVVELKYVKRFLAESAVHTLTYYDITFVTEGDGIKTIYLSTNTSSMRVAQFRKNNRACMYFCDSRFYRGAMLRGTVEVLTDSASKEMIWEDGDTMYYTEGVTDPDYCVLKFTATSGRFYSNFKSESFVVV